MTKRATKSDANEPLVFLASLPTSGRRQALSLDGEGAAILTLEIPEDEAPRLVSRFHELRDRTFFVSIVLRTQS
jgi:hypothetical protein